MNHNVWGSSATQFFYSVGAHDILDAVDALGPRTTGRVLALNSMENRVYEVEIENEAAQTPSERFLIVKFYRPGRWTREQILEEHQFLFDLIEEDIPAIAPLKFNGESLFTHQISGIFYALFPKRGGRLLDELDEEKLQRLGRTMARIHQVGKRRESLHRMKINPETFGRANAQFLVSSKLIPADFEQMYLDLVEQVAKLSLPLFAEKTVQRLHGDVHRGNILWNGDAPFLIDFDDMVVGPPVQDLWLILPGRDEEAKEQRFIMLEAYESMNSFDYMALKLIEPLRALRMINFKAWIGKRYEDQAFQRAFPQYGTPQYWREQVMDLREQIELIQNNL